MKVYRVRIFCCALVLLFTFSQARADRVDDYVRARMGERHVPGLALAVVRDGKPVKVRGYGLADVELNVPVGTETVFEIGSVTKQFTAAAVMMLVEEGKVGLDDRIAKYLPPVPPAWESVTVRQLLTHTSGIKNYTGLSGFELEKHLTKEQFIKAVSGYPLDFAPGEKWSYSNTGFNLLGMIVEKASGQSYWDFMRARVFGPLGMTATTDRNPRLVIPNRAAGYEWRRDHLEHRDTDFTDLFSAGAIVSTITDMVKWDAALNGERLLKRSSLETLWTPAKLNKGESYPYGLGWFIESVRGHRVIRHSGSTSGFSSSITRYPDDRLSVIVLCNLGTEGVAGRISQGVARMYVPALSLNSLQPASDDDARSSALLRDALAQLLQGRPDPALYAPERRAALSSDATKATLRRLASYGALSSFTFIRQDAEGRKRSRLYRVSLGDHTVFLKFVLDGEAKVSDFTVEEEN